MVRLLFFMVFLGSASLSAQVYYERSEPTSDGELTYFFLTQKGYETLLKPIELGDLGELASELLTIRSELAQLRKDLEELKGARPIQSRFGTFKSLVNKGYTDNQLLRYYSEKDLIDIGVEVGYAWTYSGTKRSKIEMLRSKL